jgi:integrase
MDEIKNKLKENRSHLSASSVNTYSSTLKNLFYKVFPDSTFDIKLFNKSKEILKYLEKVEPNKRKSILSSLFVLTKDPVYQKNMVHDINNYEENIKMEIKQPKEEENWLSKEELDEIYQREKQIYNHLAKKKNHNIDDLQQMQNYIILSLYTLIPPRRSLDYTEMKIKNPEVLEDNYIDKNDFVFNRYKTSKFYNQQREKISKELMSILKKWIKFNPTDYLLFDSNKNKLTPSKLTRRLNRTFGKNISTSSLRKFYISHKYQNYIKENEELAEDFSKMGSSIIQKDVYLKKDT